MKVLKVIDKLNIGGAERVFVDLSNILHDSNQVDVELCILEDKGELDELLNKEINITYLESSKKGLINSLIKLRRLSKKHDIIHVHMRHVYKFVALSNYFFHRKIIFQDHSGSVNFKKKINFSLRYIFKPKFYIGVSNFLCKEAYLNLGNSCKIFQLTNIIVPQPKYIDPSKSNKIVLVGNFKPIKNQIFALKLLKHSDYCIDFYGEIQDEKYYADFLSYINENKLNNRVRVISGNKNVTPILGNYLFGLSCSKSESGPLILLEYLSQGLPFLSFKTGSVAEKLSFNYPELFCQSYDVNDWLEKMKILDSFCPEYCNSIFKNNYSLNQYKSECIKIYNQVLYS